VGRNLLLCVSKAKQVPFTIFHHDFFFFNGSLAKPSKQEKGEKSMEFSITVLTPASEEEVRKKKILKFVIEES
jgi:hypothetical protein